MVKLFFNSLFAVGLSLFVLTSSASETLSFSTEVQSSYITINQFSSTAMTRSVSNSGIVTEQWTAGYEVPEIVLIDYDGISVPIVLSPPAITLSNADKGTFTIQNGTMRGVTAQPVQGVPHAGGTFDMRPTIFVSIPGFEPNGDSLGNGVTTGQPWLWNLDDRLETEFNANRNRFQYTHLVVDWKTNLSISIQVDDVSKHIKSILNEKSIDWDIVIIGHSRGGIFAHELANKLMNHNNTGDTHTFLLDPTAAAGFPFVDKYPTHKRDPNDSSRHFGSLFYDDQGLTNTNFEAVYGPTTSDKAIPGYENYGRENFKYNSTHSEFAIDWIGDPQVDSGFNQAFADLLLRKDSGNFMSDGDSSETIVLTVKPESGFQLNGGIEITGDHVYMEGSLNYSGFTLSEFQAVVGAKEVSVAMSVVFASAQLAITEGSASVSASMLGTNLSATVDDGVFISADAWVANGDVNVDGSGLYIEIDIGGWSAASLDTEAAADYLFGNNSFVGDVVGDDISEKAAKLNPFNW